MNLYRNNTIPQENVGEALFSVHFTLELCRGSPSNSLTNPPAGRQYKRGGLKTCNSSMGKELIFYRRFIRTYLFDHIDFIRTKLCDYLL